MSFDRKACDTDVNEEKLPKGSCLEEVMAAHQFNRQRDGNWTSGIAVYVKYSCVYQMAFKILLDE